MYRESYVIVMQNNINITKLINDYVDEYNKQEHPFLLFQLAHVHENDHTRVLLSVLRHNKHQFFPSFLNMLRAPSIKNPNTIKITEQQTAKGNKGTGYIDLYIEYESNSDHEKMIIENKICGANDTKKQLARYIATAIKIGDCDFDNYYQQWKNENNKDDKDFSHVHVAYLTSDGGKEPSKESLPMLFRESDGVGGWKGRHINYYPINYIDHIIPWLENDVLPKVPYADDGMMIAGIRQYIASLKKDYCRNTESQALTEWIENEKKACGNNIYCLYLNIKQVLTELKKQQNTKDDPKQIALTQLSKDLYNYQKHLFNEEAPEGWSLYFTPSFILMFKDSWWSDSDKKANYNFPSIHLNCSPTRNFFKNKGKLTWRLKIERLPKQGTMYNLNGNNWIPIRNSIVKVLGYGKRTSVDFENKKDDRTTYFKNLIEIDDTIKEINKIIEKCRDDSFQDALLKGLNITLKPIPTP